MILTLGLTMLNVTVCPVWKFTDAPEIFISSIVTVYIWPTSILELSGAVNVKNIDAAVVPVDDVFSINSWFPVRLVVPIKSNVLRLPNTRLSGKVN